MTRTGVSNPTGETKEGGHMTDCACPLCVVPEPKTVEQLVDQIDIDEVLALAEEADNIETWECEGSSCGAVPASHFPACCGTWEDNGSPEDGYYCIECCGCSKCDKQKVQLGLKSSWWTCVDCGNKLKKTKWPKCVSADFDPDLDGYACVDCCACEECCESPYYSGHGSHDSGGESYGMSTKPGWVIRGVTVELKSKSNDWQKYWTIPHNEIDLAQEMSDFYIREFIASNMGCHGIDRSLIPEMIWWSVDEAQTQLDDQITKLDPIFQAYIDMAVGGELRYHKAMREVGLGKGNHNREQAWGNWFHIREQVGPEALLDAAKLARELGKKTNILGENWAVPAEILHARITGKIDPKTFIDRSFSLQHNGGALFNKLGWKKDNRVGWNMEAIKVMIGPAHAANPIRWSVLLAAASNQATALLQRYWVACNKVKARLGMAIEPMPTWKDDLKMGGLHPSPHYVWVDEQGKTNIWPVWSTDQVSAVDLFFGPEEIDKFIDFEVEYAEILEAAKDFPETISHDHYIGSSKKCSGCYAWYKAREQMYELNGTVDKKIQLLELPGTDKMKKLIRQKIKQLHSEWWTETFEKHFSAKNVKYVFGNGCSGGGVWEKPTKPSPDHVWKPGGGGGGGKWVLPKKDEIKVDYVPTQSLHASGSGVDVAGYWATVNSSITVITYQDLKKAWDSSPYKVTDPN